MHDSELDRPILYIFSGLPASGKSTLAQAVARYRGAVYLRIDTIEQELRESTGIEVQAEGYRLAYRIAADNLRLGLSVVADSCNPIELTRREWEAVAREAGAAYLNVEVVCSDPGEHRERAESRPADVPGLRLPTWREIQDREYHPWSAERLVIDTAGRSRETCVDDLLARLPGGKRSHADSWSRTTWRSDAESERE
ncbi:MAG: AAA family ATPase [Candidatus Eisenbacteria bacterium]|nr:AAA family ATPase [Candidatus Eisenbacteria bacterium]